MLAKLKRGNQWFWGRKPLFFWAMAKRHGGTVVPFGDGRLAAKDANDAPEASEFGDNAHKVADRVQAAHSDRGGCLGAGSLDA